MLKSLKHTYPLLEFSLKTVGTYDPEQVLPYIEEQLTFDQHRTLKAFLTWVNEDCDKRQFGHGNYEERFQEWRNK